MCFSFDAQSGSCTVLNHGGQNTSSVCLSNIYIYSGVKMFLVSHLLCKFSLLKS